MQSPHAPESVAATAPPTPQVSSPVGWLDRWPVMLRLFVTTLVALAAITAVTVTTVTVTARERAAFTRLVMLERVQRTLREARAGNLSGGSLEKNRTQRCDALPAQDRSDCLARMSGAGSASGTARDGGIIREATTPASPQ